jgi:electron transfer flavoprotein beta subunit
MAELHTVVCVKVVPKPEEIRVDEERMVLIRSGVRSEINPPDMNALEMALKLKDRYGGQVSILSMGPALFDQHLRSALAMGCDHIYLLSDREFAGADTLATTYTLAAGIKKIGGVNLILCGEESSDGATGQVPPGLAEWLGINQLTMVENLDLDTETQIVKGRRGIKGGYEILEVPFPAVVSAKTASNEPRFMDYTIKSWALQEKRLTVWTKSDLDVDDEYIGLSGSPTVVSGLAEAPVRARKREFVTGTTEEIAKQLAEILKATF